MPVRDQALRNGAGRLPSLPTTVVGSDSVPEWLGRLKTEYYQRRISAAHLAEIHEVAIKAAIKEAVNIVTAGVPATWALHVCHGNRHARPSWEGHYDFLFPAVLDARVDQLVLEFARETARRKLHAIVAGTAIVRAELGLPALGLEATTSQTPGE